MAKHNLDTKENYPKTKYHLSNLDPTESSQLNLSPVNRISKRRTISLPNPTLLSKQNLFSFSTLNPDTGQNLVSTHAPNFGIKCPFISKLSFVMMAFLNGRLNAATPCSWCGRRAKNSSLPFTSCLPVHTIGICRFTIRLFIHMLPQLNSGVKTAPAPR